MEVVSSQSGQTAAIESPLKDSVSSAAPSDQVYQTVNFLISTEDAQSLTNALASGTTIDGLNLPSDTPLVVVQQEEEDEDEEGLDNYPADPKLRKTHASNTKFLLRCEWTGCPMKGRLFSDEGIVFECNELVTHMKEHLLQIRDDIQKMLIEDERLVDGQSEDDEPVFKCLWEDCDFAPVRKFDSTSDSKPIDLQFEELTRHVFFHVFHSKIKYMGYVVSKRNKLDTCQFNPDSRNLIPDLPDRIRCEWDNCDTAFDNPLMYYTHVAKHIDELPETPPLKCKWSDCNKMIKQRGHVKEHMRMHTQEKCIGCPQCGGMFCNKTKFSDHIARQQSEAVQIFHCQYCSKKFGLERLLRNHMRQHVNHYKCPLCDMTCAFPANLRHHIQYKHSEYRPHCCPRCPYMAKTHYDLTKHLNNHELESTYECDVDGCDFSSVSLECFKKHGRQHDLQEAGIAKRRFQCHVCAKEFTRGTNLTSHLKNNHKVKWPEGLKRFKYVLYEDGFYRLQAVRYESIELTQQLMQSSQNQLSAAPESAEPSSDSETPAGGLVIDSRAPSPTSSVINSGVATSVTPAAASASTAAAATSESSGNENLEMLGDVASLLQSPSKKSLPQRKTRGKRKRDDDGFAPTLKKSKRCAEDAEQQKKQQQQQQQQQEHQEEAIKPTDRENDEDDKQVLYKLVQSEAMSSPFAVFAASTPSTMIGSVEPQSSLPPSSVEPQSSLGPPSIESDGTLYHLVPSVGTPESGVALYRLADADAGVGSVGSSTAAEEEEDDDEDEGPPSSVPLAEEDGGFSKSLGRLKTVAVVDSPGFLSSPEENVLFRLADTMVLPDELAVESPWTVVEHQDESGVTTMKLTLQTHSSKNS